MNCVLFFVLVANNPDDLGEWKIVSEMRPFSFDQFQYMLNQWGKKKIQVSVLPSLSPNITGLH